jgi:hypothetical protein
MIRVSSQPSLSNISSIFSEKTRINLKIRNSVDSGNNSEERSAKFKRKDRITTNTSTTDKLGLQFLKSTESEDSKPWPITAEPNLKRKRNK